MLQVHFMVHPLTCQLHAWVVDPDKQVNQGFTGPVIARGGDVSVAVLQFLNLAIDRELIPECLRLDIIEIAKVVLVESAGFKWVDTPADRMN